MVTHYKSAFEIYKQLPKNKLAMIGVMQVYTNLQSFLNYEACLTESYTLHKAGIN